MLDSPAYQLALELRSALKQNTKGIMERLENADGGTYARGFAEHIGRLRQVAITMTLAECVRMLTYGAWLNMYEAEAIAKVGNGNWHSGSNGKSKEKATFDERRKLVEHALSFGEDVHYASLVFGGAPEPRYGKDTSCYVVLDLQHWQPQATCYAGDSCRVCFEAGGDTASDAEIRKYFAVADDWWDLVLLRHETHLMEASSSQQSIVPHHVRTLLEDPDVMIEMHLHGPVTHDQIRAVVISEALDQRCRSKVREWEARGRPKSHVLADAPRFEALLHELHRRSIVLLVGEGK